MLMVGAVEMCLMIVDVTFTFCRRDVEGRLSACAGARVCNATVASSTPHESSIHAETCINTENAECMHYK